MDSKTGRKECTNMNKNRLSGSVRLWACCIFSICLLAGPFISGAVFAEEPETLSKEPAAAKPGENVTAPEAGEDVKAVTPEVASGEGAQTAPESQAGSEQQASDIYSEDLKPLDTRECARCHYGVYMTIKDAIKQGEGVHRLDCKFCHEKFHSFQRGLTWDQRVPHCQDCHELPHGETEPMTKCLGCHANAHAPVLSIKLEAVEPYCARCHTDQKEEMTRYPSGHSAVECSICHHDRHGFKPACTECHEEPHTPFRDNQGCMTCHPVHMPANLNYGPEMPDNVCAGCHDGPAGRMKITRSKHGKLHCAFCHARKHGDIPECQVCHSIPHAEKMIKKFGSCSKCHGNPHDLNLVKKDRS